MEKRSATNVFLSISGKILSLILALNLISLLFELTLLDNFESLSYQHGYFILNDHQVGINLFANLFALLILSAALTIYSLNQRKTQQFQN